MIALLCWFPVFGKDAGISYFMGLYSTHALSSTLSPLTLIILMGREPFSCFTDEKAEAPRSFCDLSKKKIKWQLAHDWELKAKAWTLLSTMVTLDQGSGPGSEAWMGSEGSGRSRSEGGKSEKHCKACYALVQDKNGEATSDGRNKPLLARSHWAE